MWSLFERFFMNAKKHLQNEGKTHLSETQPGPPWSIPSPPDRHFLNEPDSARITVSYLRIGDGNTVYQFKPKVGKYSTHGLGGGEKLKIFLGILHPYRIPGVFWNPIWRLRIFFRWDGAKFLKLDSLNLRCRCSASSNFMKFPTVKGRFLGDFRNENNSKAMIILRRFLFGTLAGMPCQDDNWITFLLSIRLESERSWGSQSYHLAHFLWWKSQKFKRCLFPLNELQKNRCACVCFFL